VRDANGLTFNLHAHPDARLADVPASPAPASPPM
jgi:hypothetical protein